MTRRKLPLTEEQKEISRIVYENYRYGAYFGPDIARALTENGYHKFDSWDSLMMMVDTLYPDDIWLPGEDSETMDPGHRVIAALRRVDKLRKVEEATPRVKRSAAGYGYIEVDQAKSHGGKP